jgi:hypothetical protein
MVDRKSFLTGAAATLVTGRKALGAPERKSERKDNLVPTQPGKAPNYWCTWAAQNYMYGHNLPELDPSLLEGDSGSALARDAIGEHQLFGADGWAKSFYTQARDNVYLLYDVG